MKIHTKGLFDNGKEGDVPILPLVPKPKKLGKDNSVTFKVRTDPANDRSPTYETTCIVLTGNEELRDVLEWRRTVRRVIEGMDATTADAKQHIISRVLKDSAWTAYCGARNESMQARFNVAMTAWTPLMTAYNAQQTLIQQCDDWDAAELLHTDWENRRNAHQAWTAARAAHVANPMAVADPGPEPPVAGPEPPVPPVPGPVRPTPPLLADPSGTRPVVATTIPDVTAGINGVIVYMTPYKALQRVKRYLRRKCRKPSDMRVKEFFVNLNRINEIEIPEMPPRFNDTQKLSNDEIVDILLYAFPSSWSGEMERQGFDAVTKTPQEVVDFCERLEVAEAVTGKPNGNGKASKDQKKSGSSKGKSSGKKYCHLHGEGSHDSNECKVLQAQAKKLKASEGGKSDGKFKNKSWTRKADEQRNKSKKELQAFMKKAVKKELNALSKKRKSEEKSDDEDEASVNNIEEVDLSGFNYTDMDNLKIESDDETDDDEADTFSV